MVTTNANDSRPRENHGRDARVNTYQSRTGKDAKTYGKGNFNNKPYNNNNKPYNKEDKENRPYNKEWKPAGQRNNGSGNGYKGKDYKGQDFKGGGSYNKDNDENDGRRKSYGNGRDQRMKDERKSANSEQQPDKFETIKRLEKEKKAMQKKQEINNKKLEKSNKPQIKRKRSNNIDWTKGYENGLYGEDDEDYTMYL